MGESLAKADLYRRFSPPMSPEMQLLVFSLTIARKSRLVVGTRSTEFLTKHYVAVHISPKLVFEGSTGC